ncbi:MAG: glycosyltransferase family 2 protein [bacterium]|jgi:cellulose synthase/poly-beta-1,6-N-acetylglucosamine synthase-like glycosyltransferase|nr:glycosyltransferase family 2 protein [candidate division KSB1 bacterium]MDH7559475.1 glycosyltransferase family 2 protein [bacterium]
MLARIAFWLSLGTILYTYVGYYLILLVWSRLRPPARRKEEGFMPTVSMVIAAHNEEKVIRDKIENCRALDYPGELVEFLFGSDGSTDATVDLISSCGIANVRLLAFPQREGKARVLTKLVPEARGEVLVFSDANTIYRPDALRKMVAHFADPSVGGVCGYLRLISPDRRASSQGEAVYWDYENRLKQMEGRIKTVFGATGGIYAIRRELFVPLPTHKMVNDDFLIPLRIVEQGYDVVYEGQAVATEYTSPRVKGEFLRKVRIGAANFNVLPEIRGLLHPRRGYVAFGLWSHKLLRWLVPFMLVFLLAANLWALGTPFFNYFFLLQSLFYLLVILGWLLSLVGVRLGVVTYAYYFVAIHMGLLVGFCKFLFGRQPSAWTRVER